MAGGGGTRLWPLSREHYPKQFLELFEKTLFQNTLLRLDGLETAVEILPPIIICNEAHRFLVIDQGSQISKTLETIILEPEGRNSSLIYQQGLNTSLPEDVQLKFLKTMKGLEHAKIVVPGYPQ